MKKTYTKEVLVFPSHTPHIMIYTKGWHKFFKGSDSKYFRPSTLYGPHWKRPVPCRGQEHSRGWCIK